MKIFIIEDDASIREELSRFLQKYGYECGTDDDFERIVEKCLAAEPDLVLLDLNLPYQDGFQICRELRRKSGVPIIVLTSRSSDFDELMSLNTGADDYITKPYNAQVLLARIQKLIPRDAIIDELWQSEEFIDENTLNVNIVRLRKKLAGIGLPDYLQTKRGMGYCV